MNNIIHCRFGKILSVDRPRGSSTDEIGSDEKGLYMKCEKDCGCGESAGSGGAGYSVVSKLEIGLVILMVLALCAIMYGVHITTGL